MKYMEGFGVEKLKSNSETSHQNPSLETGTVYHALDRKKEKDLLIEFTPEQQAEIKHKQQILSSLANFIGKDFQMPVELNEPGVGWHWDFQANIVRIDPKDLLELKILATTIS
jgi:hypothetical protein